MIIPAILTRPEHKHLNQTTDRILKIVSTADLHIGRFDLSYQYNTIKNQIINILDPLDYDIFVIAGDYFPKKELANLVADADARLKEYKENNTGWL